MPGPPPIRLRLLVPNTSLSLGNIRLDPLEALLGVPLEKVLAPVLEAGPQPVAPGTLGYTLRLRPGDSVLVPLGPLGELGLAHSVGLLGLSVPALLAVPVREHLGAWVVQDHGMRFNDVGALVARFHLRPGPGMRAAIGLPAVGTLALEGV